MASRTPYQIHGLSSWISMTISQVRTCSFRIINTKALQMPFPSHIYQTLYIGSSARFLTPQVSDAAGFAFLEPSQPRVRPTGTIPIRLNLTFSSSINRYSQPTRKTLLSPKIRRNPSRRLRTVGKWKAVSTGEA